jgi:hypothetical protein
MSSDIIKELSHTSPLLAGANFTTEKVIAGQFAAINISFASDTDTSVVTQFSNDGANWDINISKSFSAGISSFENIVILGKWIRLSITNTSLSNQTYLRVYTYGSVSNSNLNAVLSKIGNKSPEVAIDNLPLGAFNDLQVAPMHAKISYVFAGGNTSIPKDDNIHSYYPDLHAGDIGASVTPSIDFTNRTINLKLNSDINNPSYIQGEPIRYHAGTGMMYRFTMKFELSDSDLGATLAIGAGYIANGVRSDFYGFGWDADISGGPNTYNNFGISYVIAGGLNFIPRTSWNVDKADGTGDLGVLDTTKLQVCQITQTYLGAGPIKFYIMNTEGNWILVHTIKFPGTRTATIARDPSFGLSIYGFIPAGAVIGSGNDIVSSGSFGVIQEIDNNLSFTRRGIEHSTLETAIGAAAETVIFSLQNFTTYNGVPKNTPLVLDTVVCSASGTGNRAVFFRIYKNGVITLPTWVLVDNYSTMRKDEVGTYAPGRCVMTIPVERNGKVVMQLDDHIVLNPEDTLTITAFSAGAADVFFSTSYHVP